MEKTSTVKIIEVCKISPCNSNSSNISLPLTSFDWLFLNTPLTKRVFYYKLTDSDSPFLDSIIPKLKKSLSLTLQHFLPVSGNLVWPENSPKPFILYTPNDSVSFSVAEIHDSDFNHLSGNNPHENKDSEFLIPTIESSDIKTPLIAIQVTTFPNHDGFSIGLSCHHVIFDGKSISLFIRAWSHICKLNQSSFSLLPESLIPSFERGNPTLDQNSSDFIPKKRSLKLESYGITTPSNWLRGIYKLSFADIEKLKKRVKEGVSTFVVSYAYALFCLIKAKQHETLGIVLTADARGLLDPPVPSNYFGNCLTYSTGIVQGKELTEEDGFTHIAKKISDAILELKSREVKASTSYMLIQRFMGIKLCTVASSPRFKSYETDFGWGKPIKFEIVSLSANGISLTDARDGSNGVEVGVVLPTHEMDIFASMFSKGLN